MYNHRMKIKLTLKIPTRHKTPSSHTLARRVETMLKLYLDDKIAVEPRDQSEKVTVCLNVDEALIRNAKAKAEANSMTLHFLTLELLEMGAKNDRENNSF